MVVPCSACYLNMRRTEDKMGGDRQTAELVNEVLKEEGLSYGGGIRVRHLLDVLATDFGADRIEAAAVTKLDGVSVVPYYGCQALRPYGGHDDPQLPTSMEPLIRALGGEVHPWSMGAKCCGAGLMTTKRELALDLVASLLEAAQGADCIATVCPMCQMNLESCQKKASKMRGRDLRISVLYLPQLIGFALGFADADLRLDLNLAITSGLRDKLKSCRFALNGSSTSSLPPRLEAVPEDRARNNSG
jgi:heterodisulfide reductase subunit B